jgi:hypothetical protein
MEKDNKNNIYFVFLIRIVNYQIKTMLKFQINSNKIKTIRDLKYFIIEQYKEKNFCPCQLMISDYFINELCYSNANNTPDENIDKCFPDHNIYINVNSDTSCDCGFHNLNSLSKLELYERYMEKIRKLILKYECIINEKEREIKNLEELNDELLNNIDRRNKIQKDKEMEFITNDINSIVKFNQYNDNINFEDFYDIIININSIKQVNQGWDIKMNERGKLRFEEYKNKQALVIGMIGNSNKGKSFLLSKISKIDLPNGTNIRTEGLSIKYPDLKKYKNRKIVLLDSEGLESPFLFQYYEKRNEVTDEKLKEKAKDKLVTEYFLQNFIMDSSDIIIAVVGLLTFQEQKFLNKIKSQISKLNYKKTLFVIHNLMTLTTVDQVKNYINNTLMNSATFDLEKTTKITTKISNGEKVEYFFEKKSKIRIIHLIFANEGSEAGKFYNNFALEFIENSFQEITDIKSFDVIENLKERFIGLSKILMENNINQIISKKDFINYAQIIKERKIRLEKKRDIILKRYYIDELGFSDLRSNGFIPCYNYFLKDDKLILRLETPGNVNISVEYIIGEKCNIIQIKGEKKKDKEPFDLKDNTYNDREFGEFSIDIPIMIYLDITIKPDISFKYGIYTIIYCLRKNTNIIYEYKGDEEEMI